MSVYIDDIIKILTQPANAGATVVGYDSNNTTGAAISALGIFETLASTAYKNSVPGTAISVASLGVNLTKAFEETHDQFGKPNGKSVSDSTMMAIASDVESLVSGVGIAPLVATGYISIEAASALTALAMIAATGMALASAMQGGSTDIADAWGDIFDAIPSATDNINGGINDALNTANNPLMPNIDGINDIIGDAAKDLGKLLDMLPDDLVPDFIDGLLGGLDDIFPNGILPYLFNLFPYELDPDIYQPFLDALGWHRPVDPLILDLDGDGIETIGISETNHTMFDSDGDGVKTATGWVGKDDGLLVLDRNGNGTIDNGSELFGDQTMVNGTKAKDGFSALSSEDTNKDGKFDANDTNFSNVRVWRDIREAA